jgi:hypothetical protein
MAKAYLSQMGSTVVTECLSEHMTALQPLSYQLVTTSLRLIAEVLGLGLIIGTPGGRSAGMMRYTGVTKELTKDWGQVSELLHYKFFIKNKEWYHKVKIFPNNENMRSLMDYRGMLGDIAQRLEEASSGDLLAPPSFLLRLIDEVNESTEE